MHIHHMRGLSWMKEVMSLGTDDKIPICSFIPWDKETSEHLNNNSWATKVHSVVFQENQSRW